MDTPGDDAGRLPRIRVVTVAVATVAAVLLVGVAIRAAGDSSAAAETDSSLVTPTPSSAALDGAAASPSAAPMLPPGQDVLVLGDSLALSTYAWLADLMPDRYVSWEARVGRTTAQARQALEGLASAGDIPPVIIVSSGTNDLSSASLRAEATRILAIAGPDRCVVWADVVRPDSFGDGLIAANDALAKALGGHQNVVPVAWTSIIAQHPDWLSGDGIHPGQPGNIARAQAFAAAVFTCSPLDPEAPVADKQYLPPSAFLSSGGNNVTGVGPSATSGPSQTASPSASKGSPSPSASGSPSPTSSEPQPTGSSEPSPPPTDPPPPDPTTTPVATTDPGGQP